MGRAFLYGDSDTPPHFSRLFVGVFNVPVQAPTRATFLNGYSEKPPHFVAFYDTLGIWRTHSRLKPQGPHGGLTLSGINK